MSKNDRLSFLRNRHAALFGVALATGFIPVSRVEIKRETEAVTSGKAENMDYSIEDSDKIEAKVSSLAFDSIRETVESESSALLSAKEKRQLAREVAFRRAVRAWFVPSTLLLTA